MTQEIQFSVKAEPCDQVLIRVLTAISRRRMMLLSFHSSLMEAEGLLHICFVLRVTREQGEKFNSQLNKQIDIHTATYCEQKTQLLCKTERPKSSLTLSRG